MATRKTPSTTPRRSTERRSAEPALSVTRHPRAATTRRTRKAEPGSSNFSVTEYIRVRAYYLSLKRRDGLADPVADWLAAERELAARDTES